MAKPLQRRMRGATIAITILCMILACRFFDFRTEEEISRGEGYYTMDSRTLLSSLSSGARDVFVPTTATPQAFSSEPARPVQWNQQDYLGIAKAFHDFVWGEPLSEWGLTKMHFQLGCSSISAGPQLAEFTYFRNQPGGQGQSRFARSITIDPTVNSIDWDEIEYYPSVVDWPTIDLANASITVSDALAIAEENGGRKARLEAQNDCAIYLALAPGSEYDGWQVGYYGKNPATGSSQTLFAIRIDPSSGEYVIMQP